MHVYINAVRALCWMVKVTGGGGWWYAGHAYNSSRQATV